MAKSARWFRLRYRTDAAWRERHLAAVKAQVEKNLKFDAYHELLKLRTKISTRRRAIERHMLAIEQCEKELLQMLKTKEELTERWKAEREKAPAGHAANGSLSQKNY